MFLSRDREGAVSARSKRITNETSHRLALLLANVSNRVSNVLIPPQVASAAVPRPSRSVGLDRVERSACVRFERILDPFRRLFRLYDHMNVTGANIRRQQRPAAVQANLG